MSSRKKTSRRTFLRGAGAAALALPMLELTHGDVLAAEGPPETLYLIHNHGGTVSPRSRGGSAENGSGAHHGMYWWYPTSDAETLSAANLGPIHTGLVDEFVPKLTILAGVDNMAGATQGAYGGGHGWVNQSHLTCADMHRKTVDGKEEPDGPKGPSFDKVLAAHFSGSTPFDAIDLRVQGHNYGTVQFHGERMPVSSEADPRAAFDRLFAGISPEPGEGPDPAVLRARARRQSVLDGVLESFNLLRGRVSSYDRTLLDAHAEHLRSIERRLDSLDGIAGPMCTIPTIGSPSDRDAEMVGPLMIDLALHAGRCGLSRVITVQINDVITSWLPTPYGHDLAHSLGHAAREVGPTGEEASRRSDWETEILANRRWRFGLFARLLRGLEDVPAPMGTMLDHSLAMYTSEFSNAAVHSCRDVPFMLAGSLCGRLRTGRFLDYNTASGTSYDTTASTHNLYTTVLQQFGVEIEHFGNGDAYFDGALPGLT